MKKESRQKESLGRILKYMKKYWLLLGLSIALAVISVILTSVSYTHLRAHET